MKLSMRTALNNRWIDNASAAVYKNRPVKVFCNLDRDTFSLYAGKDVVLTVATCNKYEFDTVTRVISRIVTVSANEPVCLCDNHADDVIRLSCLLHSHSGPFLMTVGGKLSKVTVKFNGETTMSIVHGSIGLLLNENRKDWLVQGDLLTYDPIDTSELESTSGITGIELADWLESQQLEDKPVSVVITSTDGTVESHIIDLASNVAGFGIGLYIRKDTL